ncbi:MAG: hypothetical protein U9R19_06440 [Bacteroidota bacterium]|nr:hypothetical protein [Bacteroidota bacterium]
MKQLSLISFFLFFLLNIASAQTLNELVKAAKLEFETGNYYAAANLYEHALAKNSNRVKLSFRLAEALRLSKDYKRASVEYRKIYTDKEELFPLSRFWYAEMMKYQGKYKKAKSAYNRFYKNYRNVNELKFFILKAKYEREVCESLSNGNIFVNNISIKLMDTLVNSEFGEFNPFEIDSTQLIFSSFRSYPVDDKTVFRSRLFWFNALNDTIPALILDTTLYAEGYYYSISPGINRNEVLLSKCPIGKNQGVCEIYMAKLHNNIFSDIKILQGDINLPNINSRHPFLTEFDGNEYLLFSSDRPGGFGGYDIWFCKRESDLTFNTCKNVGANINSILDEITPFYYPNDTLLYFSSSWHGAYGGFDIFQSYGNFAHWEQPYNLGLPINSSYDDLYYSFNDKSRRAYFVSNRTGGMAFENETCCNDIYTYNLPWSQNDSLREMQRITLRKKRMEQKIASLKLLTPLELYFDNDQPNPKSKDTVTLANLDDLTNNYLEQQQKYISIYTRGLKRQNKQDAEDAILSLFMDDIEANRNKVEQFCKITEYLLNRKKTIVITLKAYTSPLNNPDYNKKLAKRRIASFENYLSEYNNGIFIYYVDNKKLIINKIAFGESKSAGKISDDISDKRNSIYSPEAARARKITIEAVEIN